jgi:hypothetical protein
LSPINCHFALHIQIWKTESFFHLIIIQKIKS